MNMKLLEKLWLLSALIGVFLIAGCKAESKTAIRPGAGAPQTQTTVTDASALEAAEPLPAEIEVVNEAEEEVDACLDCHSDKERLIATADPEEEVVEESEGEG